MSAADYIILILLLLFALGGLKRGFIWEVLTSVGLIGGLALTYFYRADLLDLIMRLAPPGWPRQWGAALVFLAFFLVIYLGFTAIGKYLSERLHKTPLKWPDRVLGLAGGALKGAILIAFLVVAVEWVSPSNRVREFVSHSELVRWGKRLTYSLIRWEPPSKRKWVEERCPAAGEMTICVVGERRPQHPWG